MAIDTISRALSGQASTAAKQAKETADSAMEQAISAVPGAVADWLEDNVTPTTPVVDASLSIAGAAADAKATGDGIADLKSAIDDILGDTLPLPEALAGYYLGNINETIRFTENASSFAYAFDLSAYVGNSVNVHFNTTSTSSRETCLCNANDVITKWDRERDMTDAGFTYNITSDNYKLYVSFSDLASDLTVQVINGRLPVVEQKTAELANNIAPAYVDGTNGNDNNEGTMSAPFKTISKAVNIGRKQIYVKPGTYSERINLYSLSDITISPYGLENFDKSTYKQKITLEGLGSRPFCVYCTNCNNIKLEGIEATNWVNSGFKLVNCSDVEIFDCTSNGEGYTGANRIGFEFINTSGKIVNSIAHDMSLDGFNFHGFGATEVINCIAYNCGDDGVSHHDACTGVISGGEFYGCGKGGVSSPTYGAYINIYNAYCHNNFYGVYVAQSAEDRDSKAIISNCLCVDNTTYDIYIRDGIVTAYNNIYNTKQIGSDASYTEYPATP